MRRRKGIVGLPGFRLLIPVLGASVFVACATDRGPPERVELEAGQTELLGWLTSSGEFRLYGTRRNMLKRNLKDCVSGAFPLERHQETMREYEGRHVRVKGRVVDWTGNPPEVVALIHEGSHIINGCRQDYVLFAREITLVE